MAIHKDIYRFVETLAPPEWAEPWDPIGQSVGSSGAETSGIVLSLDLTNQAVDLAEQTNANLIITHHPAIFSPLSSINAEKSEQALLLRVIENRITVFSMHTNLDAAPSGVADSLVNLIMADIVRKEPDYPLIPLNVPDTPWQAGHGRVVQLGQQLQLSRLVKLTESRLSTNCQLNLNNDFDLNKIVFFPGSLAEEWLPFIREHQINAVVCGEAKHHLAVWLAENQIALVLAGHGSTEQPVLPVLADRLKEAFPDISCEINPGPYGIYPFH